ncbi:MAG: hypothetical protein GKR89_24490 [Candidatus Latescibacteria bacterium]|nr:hypothetical protein [Candidatus Latescibacterota bacterium]
MSRPQLRLLVPLEKPVEEDALVRFATALARARNGEIHLAHIATGPTDTAQIKAGLQRAANQAAAQGVKAVPHLLQAASVVEGIRTVVDQTQSTMMVLGWYREVEENAVRGSRSSDLTKVLDLDILIFKERSFQAPRRILVPSSGGNHSLMGIQVGYELSQSWDAQLEILRIARDPLCRPSDPILQRYCAQLRADIKLQMDLLKIDAPIQILPAQDVVKSVVGQVEPDDLVILGASNDWRHEGYLAGSIPDEIAAQVPCSVLMVRSPAPNKTRLSHIFWESNIRLALTPTDNFQAIEQMVDTLIEEKQIPQSQRQLVLKTALQRESKTSTALGHETAIPHAAIPDIPSIIGGLGLCPQGVDFKGVYPEPVRFIFLLLTPQQNYRNYIPVLSQIAGLMRLEKTRAQLMACENPAQVAALLRRQEKS